MAQNTLTTNENDKPITGFIVGRFQPLHIGHIYMIQNALVCVDKLLIFVGSANEKNTVRNPLAYEVRYDILTRALLAEFPQEMQEGRIIVKPLNDLKGESNNHPSWGDYLMENVLKYIETPTYYLTGAEVMRTNWFDENKYGYLNFVCVSKDVAKISSTEVREIVVNNGDYTHLSPYMLPTEAELLRTTILNLK
ncbi:MAG: adenylyltransferase/cytidyltransferase family protein [Bacteroidales bacterium]